MHIQTVIRAEAAGKTLEHTELCFERETALARPPRRAAPRSVVLLFKVAGQSKNWKKCNAISSYSVNEASF